VGEGTPSMEGLERAAEGSVARDAAAGPGDGGQGAAADPAPAEAAPPPGGDPPGDGAASPEPGTPAGVAAPPAATQPEEASGDTAEPAAAVETAEPDAEVPAAVAAPAAPPAADAAAEATSTIEATEGWVYLVGAGPGDPGLLTLRGRELLARADVVVYDRLVDPAVLALIPPEAERVYAGKAPGAHTLTQADINRTLVERASRGLHVVRLKGGDPFVFGRGAEECLALQATGIPFEVVPGVTAAIAAPAYAGIPLTHRDVASSFAVVTGQRRADGPRTTVDWSAYGRQPDTVVVLMGVGELPQIVEGLIAGGRPRETPSALVAEGTTPRQRVVVAPLAELPAAAAVAGLANPATLVVGEVVRLRERVAWFERKPLFGRRIVVTRTREQSSELAATLRQLGAEPVEVPVLSVEDNPNPRDLDWVVTHIATFWWICFTSAHALRPFFAALRTRGLDARSLAGTRIACVGPATARELAKYGLTADLVPERATAADLAEAMQPQVYPGQKVLYVSGHPTSDVLVSRLQRAGCEVRQAIVYQAGPDPAAAPAAERLLAEGADAVTFASSATVGYFLDATGQAGRELCARAKVVCIGPVTARAAQALGLRVDAVAGEASMAGMTSALLGLWGQEGEDEA
jgi:uroporphyrinogen III methyltransferase/synthase